MSVMKVYKTETERQYHKAADTVVNLCVCAHVCPLSLSTGESPKVNVVHYNIHEAAGLQSGVKAILDIATLTLSPLPSGYNDQEKDR